MDIDAFIRQAAQGWRLEEKLWIAPAGAAVAYSEARRQQNFAIEDLSFWFEHRNRCLKAVLRRFPPAGVFLDVGGGNGLVTRYLYELGIPALLLEPGIAGCRHALERGVTHVLCGRFEQLQWGAVKAGAIGFFDVLEHIEDESGFLNCAANALEAHGRLYLTVPAWPLLWSHLDIEAGHFRRYTAAGLERVLQKAGFRLLYTSYFFSPLPPALFFLRALPFRLGWARPAQAHAIPKSQHLSGSPLLRRLALRFLAGETIQLGQGQIPWGASLICVAEKNVSRVPA